MRNDGDSVAYRLRQNFFYSFLDKLLSELDKRFNDQACDLLSDAAAFYPQHLSPTNVHKVENLAKFYKLDEKLGGQQYLLFSQSIIYKNWKLDFFFFFFFFGQKSSKKFDQNMLDVLTYIFEVVWTK